MVLTPKLELRQSQQLVMTPQLQQAIRLLQFSNLELSQYVEAELERNPLLERDETAPEPPEEAARREPTVNDDADGDGGWELDEAPDRLGVSDLPESLGTDNGMLNGHHGDHRPGEPSGWASVRPSTHNGSAGESRNLEEFVAAAGSLTDHLMEQLHLAVADPAERMIGIHLIHMVDEGGYLQGSLEELADKLGASRALVGRVLATVQSFDPPGVFARSLAECLALQLKDLNRYDPQIAKLLDNLPLLGSHNLTALKRAVTRVMHR